jgi:hypothetical protein
MKTTPALLSALFALVCQVHAAPVPLFDGKTFDGWEGDIDTVWRIGDGAFVAGSLEKKQAKNNFLATRKDYADFELTLKWKLEGTKGFVNGGVHEQRRARHPALAGQAGDPADILLLGAFAQGLELDETDECGYAIGYWSHRPPPSPRLHPLSCHQTPGQSLIPAKRLRSTKRWRLEVVRRLRTSPVKAAITNTESVMSEPPVRRTAGRIALQHAFFIPVLFTVLFLFTYPPIPSEPPFTPPNLIPATIVFALGVIGWCKTFFACLRAFRHSGVRPSVVTSFVFFLLYGLELCLAAFSLHAR